ncbi:uroporphyrinogen-III C-methyltransferase [Saccharospirillum mangrovi]|uniref:uroporphyrinogen-III C-methyltransferase n=1 Tax=Saccharospirillum mangrovi TaxID=2161747 RepID=UPI000D3A8482|nr:uroporphyrinogen-III C-methyltransferase [Saccharospirillum mangrovi]
MTEHDKQTPSTESVSSQPAEKNTAQTPPKAKSKPVKTAKKKGSGRGWRVFLVLLIVLGLLAGAGYYWGQPYYQSLLAQWSQWRALPQQQAALAAEIERLNNELNAERQARSSFASALQNTRSELEQMIVDTAQRLSRRDDLDTNQWPLEEALALLRLSERRLQLDGNAQVALNLLDAADQVLANMTAAAVLPVRRQIAQDRLALQSIDAPDINGLYFRLDAIDDRIANFQWTPAERLAPQDQTQASSADEPLSPWAAFRNSLGSLVTVTRLDAPHQASPLLDDFERWRQHSRLLLEEVQLALLSREQALFDAALAQLTEQLTPMRQELDVEPLIAQLTELAGTQLNPTLPDISASVRALETYLSRSGDAEGDS